MSTHDDVSVRVPRHAFVPSPVFVGLLLVFGGSAYAAWERFGNARLAVFAFVISGWLVSLCLHEYAHALAAYRFGDLGVAERGYLKLNPLKYSHPLLSIVLPVIVVLIGGIGLPGGAVWVDHGRIPGRLRHSLVSAAGPATNVLFALALAVPFHLGADIRRHLEFWAAVGMLAVLQIMASVLNFLPVPGLDGGNLLHPWLSPRWQRGYNLMAPYGFLLLFALLWRPEIGIWFARAVFRIAGVIGVNPALYSLGRDLLMFWT
jgi:Zn-dependent protease